MFHRYLLLKIPTLFDPWVIIHSIFLKLETAVGTHQQGFKPKEKDVLPYILQAVVDDIPIHQILVKTSSDYALTARKVVL